MFVGTSIRRLCLCACVRAHSRVVKCVTCSCWRLTANCAGWGLWYHVGLMQPGRLTIRRWVWAMSLGEVWNQIVASVSAGTLPDLGAWSYVLLLLLVFVEGPAATLVAAT